MSSMLHRSFKPAKCKTALKLAVSRIKLLKNKREAHVRQLKRELAQLLESGQDQTARIRVEHVIREEKTMAAYDLVEIYCELIAARLPMIESQKNCPIDLKEAISSVIFASPRCSDIPEIIDIRKHLTAKYGKEFVSAAVELRPDCGVNRLLVEKLSAKAPDGPTKIKILAAIAEEHNIKWEPKSFGENDIQPSQDLLVGPNSFEKAAYVEPSQVHIPPFHDEKGSPNLHAPSQLKPMHDISVPMHDIPTGSYEQNASGAARKDSGNQPTISGMSNPKIMSSGSGSQEMDYKDSYSENRSAFPVGRQNGTMEFKDAASAAQAAAESAERASMAARAAAELSSRENITRQHSNGSHSSSSSQLRDEIPQDYAFHDDQHLSTGSVNSTFKSSSSGMHNERINAREQDNLVGAPNEYYRNSQENAMKHAQSGSLTSVGSFDDNPFASGSQMADIYQHNSFEQGSSDFHGVSIERQASGTEADFVAKLHADSDLNSEDNFHFGDATTNRQSRQASSSQLISPSDDHNDNLNLSGWRMGNKAVEDQFITGEGHTMRNTMETSNDTSVVFDDSGSEDDDYKFNFDNKYKEEFFASPGIKSQVDLSDNTNYWSHGQDINKKESISSSRAHFSMVSEGLTKSAISSEKEDMPVTFDGSDDSGSDSEVDLVKSKFSGNFGYVNSVLDRSANHGALGSSLRTDKDVGSDRESWLSPSLVRSDTLEEHLERKADINSVSGKNFGYNDLPTSRPYSRGRSSILDLDPKTNIHASESPDTKNDTGTSQESQIESGKELNYGTLKGGLRNKAYRRPLNIKSTLSEVSSSSEGMSVQNERSLPTMRTSISSDGPAEDRYMREASTGKRSVGSRVQSTFSDSDNNDLAKNSQESVTSTLEPRTQTGQSETRKKSSSRTSITFFDSDDADSEDEHPKQNSASFARPVSGISRRTSAPSKAGRGLSSKDAPLYESSATPRTKLGWKSSRASHESQNQEASSMKSSENWSSSEPRSGEQAAPKPISEPNRSSREEATKSSASAQPSSSPPMKVIQDSGEGQEASKSLSSDAGAKEKAGHVHPKLPDYDSFAAHFLSLRKGRQ